MLSKIRLELARTKEYLEGTRYIGYEFTAPLGANGKIDVAPKIDHHCPSQRRKQPKYTQDCHHT